MSGIEWMDCNGRTLKAGDLVVLNMSYSNKSYYKVLGMSSNGVWLEHTSTKNKGTTSAYKVRKLEIEELI